MRLFVERRQPECIRRDRVHSATCVSGQQDVGNNRTPIVRYLSARPLVVPPIAPFAHFLVVAAMAVVDRHKLSLVPIRLAVRWAQDLISIRT